MKNNVQKVIDLLIEIRFEVHEFADSRTIRQLDEAIELLKAAKEITGPTRQTKLLEAAALVGTVLEGLANLSVLFRGFFQ